MALECRSLDTSSKSRLYRQSRRRRTVTEGSTDGEENLVWGPERVRWCSGEDGCPKAAEVSNSIRQHKPAVLPRAVPEWQSPRGIGG
jgi:hypothetical protein